MLSRSDFLLDPEIVFLNHGSFGACPIHLLREQRIWQEVLEREPVAFFHALPERMKGARAALGGFVDASRTDLVFVQNSTFGANVMAYAMARHLKPGDDVLIPDHEYGACRRAWEFHLRGTGINIVPCHIPIPIPTMDEVAERIWEAVTEATRAIFISHITSPTACLLPVGEIAAKAKQRDILMLVDGAHVPGHITLSLRTLGVDAYTANLHKWMCTPKGSAFLWVRSELQPFFPPLVGSWGNHWLSVEDGAFIDEHEYVGTRDPSPFLVTQAALDWMKHSNWTNVVAGARELVHYGMAALAQLGLQPVSADWADHGLMMGAVLLPEGTQADVLQRALLRDHRIQTICMQWLGVPILRFSVHGYTTKQEVDALIGALPAQLNL